MIRTSRMLDESVPKDGASWAKEMAMYRYAVCLSLSLLVSASRAEAQPPCDQTRPNLSDVQFFNFHGCDALDSQNQIWFPLFYFKSNAWNVQGSNGWSPDRGFEDACNISKEFPKHWNSAFLIEEGMDPNFGSANIPWHSSLDYSRIGRGAGNVVHPPYRHSVANANISFDKQPVAYFSPGGSFLSGNIRQVVSLCGMFTQGFAFNSVAGRAAVLLHEGWHAWEEKRHYEGHVANPPGGSCTVAGKSCDFFFFHNLDDFPDGQMWQFTADGRLFHNPSQVQSEYLCDVVTTSVPGTPNSVLITANTTQVVVNQFLINGPAPGCSVPRPFSP
jgi:hypothetical protein